MDTHFVRRLIAVTGTVAVLLMAYAPSFRGAFVFDDVSEIVDNPAICVPWPPTVSMTQGGRLPHRPLPYWTFALNYVAGGLEPWSYHAVNFAFHVANGALVWWLTRYTLRHMGRSDADAVAWLAATLWLIHPLTTQAVTYVYQRMEVMAATTILATLACFVQSTSSPRSNVWRVAALLIACVGGLCKETVTVIPLVILLYDGCFVAGSVRGALTTRPLFYGVLAAICLIPMAIVFMQRSLFRELTQPTWTPAEYLLAQPLAIAEYLRLVWWPAKLCLDRGWRPPAFGFAVFAAAAFMIGVLIIGWIALYRHTPIGFVILGFFTLLLPTSSLMPLNDICVEHRMYLPLALLVVASVVVVLPISAASLHRYALVPFIFLAGVLATGTATRNAAYASRLTIWADTAAKAPWNARAHDNVADELVKRGRFQEALTHVTQALENEPRYAPAWVRRAIVLGHLGKRADAVAACRQAVDCNPGLRGARVALTTALLEVGDPAAAVTAGEEALAEIPEFLSTLPPRETEGLLTNIAIGQALLDDPRCTTTFRAALRAAPDSADAHYNLGKALLDNDPATASLLLMRALELDPTNRDAAILLGGPRHAGRAKDSEDTP